MTFQDYLYCLQNQAQLSENQAYNLMQQISLGNFNEAQTAALITLLSHREVALEEIIGFRKALLELSLQTDLPQYESIDLCGTGGDGKNTFNISTLAAFVVAAAGYPVAKHGNYGVSSVSGSSNVLEYLGYQFSNDNSLLIRQLEEHNLCFLHAPLFHPALKNVATIRKQLGIKTIFNTLGPLVNPAQNAKQLVGVFHLKLARLYHYILQKEGKSYVVLHSLDGYDEISLTGKTHIFSSKGEKSFLPQNLELNQYLPAELFGGDTVAESAQIFVNILEGKATKAQREVVLANAAFAIQCFEEGQDFADSFQIAAQALDSKKAFSLLKALLAFKPKAIAFS
ncbi:anthranilate phosphoribosyltransferase [Hugenholtzia roseola]|uniref:anthranilate phosphoribosyltransferase n=1 Tax=Hugenholtzia roseola TaxID=1002 RepID=UPI0003F77DD0|nr:anthranilate phosphoribosyltransferase [Hugenholtzia roseola]